MTPRPLIVIASNTSWSILNFRLGLIEALAGEGFDVAALAPADAHTPRLPCRSVSIRMDRGGKNPFSDLLFLHRLKCAYRSLQPTAILHFTPKINIYGSIAAHGLGIPGIVNITGLGTGFLGGGPVALVQQELYRFALRFPDTVFFQNADDHRLFLDRRLVEAQQAELLPGSGIDLDRFAPCESASGRRFAFLMIARLMRDKGIYEYIEAARILKQAGLPADFRVIGYLDEGNPTSVSRGELECWIGEGTIEYLGRRNDVRDEIARADCVVLPSYREGTPRSLLEAAAMARPLITTRAPGCREVVEDGLTGYLCGVRDGTDLAEKMKAMVGLSCQERHEMGARGRAKMERSYDEKIVIRKYIAALRRIVP